MVAGGGLFIDPSSKIFSPKSVRDDSDEACVLFHFSSLHGDEERLHQQQRLLLVAGRVSFLSPGQSRNGSGSGFWHGDEDGLWRLYARTGQCFRTNESAPIFQIERDETSSDENDMGYWRLVK